MHRIGVPAVAVALLSACNAVDLPMDPSATLIPVATYSGIRSSDYAFTRIDLGTLGGSSSFASDINKHDVVVGWSTTADGAVHAFRWSEAQGMTDLGTLPGDTESYAAAVLDDESRDGWLILGSSRSADGQSIPVVWSESGVITPLPIPVLPPFGTAWPTDFNARGDVVGDAFGGNGAGERGWIWSNRDGISDLSDAIMTGGSEGAAVAITDRGVALLQTTAAGCGSPISQCWRVHLWSRRDGYVALGTLGGERAVDVFAGGLNEGGTVVGSFSYNSTPPHTPWRWSSEGGFTLLPRLSSDGFIGGLPTAVDNADNAVGMDSDPSGFGVAVLWPAAGGVVTLDGGPPTFSIAFAINERATIAGQAPTDGGESHAVIWVRGKTRLSGSAFLANVSLDPLSDARAHCLTDPRVVSSRAALSECLMNAARALDKNR